MSMLKSHSHTLTLSYSHTISLSQCLTLTLSFTHSPHAEQLSCLCSKVTLTLCHSFSLSNTHSFNLSFTHSRHAEQLLSSCLCSKLTVYSRKLQCVFFDLLLSVTLSCYFRCHRAGSQLKIKNCAVRTLSILGFRIWVLVLIRVLGFGL